MLQPGNPAPDFVLQDLDGTLRRLSDYRGNRVALYFYPKDGTPTCTKQACSLRDSWDQLTSRRIMVIGISPDTPKQHGKFILKHNLPFTLLSDPDHAVCDAYGVWGEKKFMGRTFDGVHRTTFLIDAQGVIVNVLSKVNSGAHAEQVVEGFN